MKKVCLLLALIMGLSMTISAQNSDFEDFFVNRGGATVAKYAHPRENFRSARVTDATSKYVQLKVTFNWTTSEYKLYYDKVEGYVFFTNIVTTSEGSLVSSFSRCDEPSLSNLPSQFVDAYCKVVGESRYNLSKMQKICAIISYQYLRF